MKSIALLMSFAAMAAVSTVAAADDLSYPDLLCGELVGMDEAAQAKAIDWLNGKVAGVDTMKLEKLVNIAYSETIAACEAAPESKVIDIIKAER